MDQLRGRLVDRERDPGEGVEDQVEAHERVAGQLGGVDRVRCGHGAGAVEGEGLAGPGHPHQLALGADLDLAPQHDHQPGSALGVEQDGAAPHDQVEGAVAEVDPRAGGLGPGPDDAVGEAHQRRGPPVAVADVDLGVGGVPHHDVGGEGVLGQVLHVASVVPDL